MGVHYSSKFSYELGPITAFAIGGFAFKKITLRKPVSPNIAEKEIGIITTRTTRHVSRLGGEAGEPSVKITYKNGTEFEMTRTRVKETEINPYVQDGTRPIKFDNALNK